MLRSGDSKLLYRTVWLLNGEKLYRIFDDESVILLIAATPSCYNPLAVSSWAPNSIEANVIFTI